MGMVLCRPGVDEQSCRHEDASGDHDWDAEFGFSYVVVLAFEETVDAVVERGEELGADGEAEAHGDVIEACDADGFAVAFGPEDGEGGEDEVHEAVEVGGVDGEDLDDGLGSEQAEGADGGLFEGFEEAAVRVVFGVEGLVAGFLDEFLGFEV